jgi:uncharacterized ferritin-like protein (DUF455 family)
VIAAEPTTFHAFCLGILESGDLDSKLAPPTRSLVDERHPSVVIDAPARDDALRLAGGAEKLPRPGELEEPGARARCLARFAHHELQAVELFAWAMLRWPDTEPALRRSWLGVIADEQRHCRMYLERLSAHGSTFGMHAPHSDYFWHQAPAIGDSPFGASAFLAAMGLTLEQANLDFTGVYRDGFRQAGDEESARVCEQVHRDEVRHVRLAAEWMERLDRSDRPDRTDRSDITRYVEAVPFPLSASRAKGRRFDVRARREAGLSEEFIEFVRRARSTADTGRP